MNEHILSNGEKLNIELFSLEDAKAEFRPGIYIIVNTDNSKVYVGQSHSIKTRLKKHFYTLETKSHYNLHFQRAYNRNRSGFKAGIIEYHDSYDKCLLSEKESFYINKFETLNEKFGYNRAIPPKSELKTFQKRKYRNAYKTSEEVLIQICDLLNAGLTRVEVSKKLGINEPVISGITSGSNYSDFTCKYLNKEILAQWKCNIEKTGLTEEERMKYIMDKARPSSAKLNTEKVIKICRFMNEGLGDTDISKIMNLACSTVNNIRRGKNWSDVSIIHLNPEILKGRVFNRDELTKIGFSKEEINKKIYKKFSKLTEEDVHDICKDIVSGTMIVRDIAKKYNIHQDSVRSIINGKSYQEITSNYFLNINPKELINSKLTDSDVDRIWEYYLEGKNKKEIEAITGVNLVKLRRIFRGACYKEAYEKYSKIEQESKR